jgi:Galactose oxidase, central domain/Kelch motif
LKPRSLSIFGLAFIAATTTGAPSTGRSGWRVEPGAPISTPRAAHQATLLDTNFVLLTGGCSGVSCTPVERSTELIDGITGQATATGSMDTARVAHAATRLTDGRVLVVGGWTGSAATATAEAFDPKTRRFSSLVEMGAPRMDATVTALASGSALVVGGATATGRPLATAELFEMNRFSAPVAMSEPRAHHSAVRLADGRVLVVGGQTERGRATASAEIFDPVTGAFAPTGSLSLPRCKHAALLLRDGRVMVIGGSTDCNEQRRIAQTEIWNPGTGAFSNGPALLNPRYKIVSAAAVTKEGDVVIAGDANDVEVWSPGSPSFVKAAGTLGKNLAFSTATPLHTGALLIIGGYDNDIRPTAQSWLIHPSKPPSNVVR